MDARPDHDADGELVSLLVAHVVISLIAIVLGLVLFYGLLINRSWAPLAAAFLASNVLTSLSGVVLPAQHFLPSHAFVILCIISLALAAYGFYARGLEGRWRRVFVVGSLFALYLNVVVLVVQSFDKIKSLPPILAGPVQLISLIAFLLLGGRALRNFKIL